jgi:hypothetical protein
VVLQRVAHQLFDWEDAPMETVNARTEDRLKRALGEAAIRIWSYLPPDVQHDLFEEVVTELGEAMRQPLAVFLHGCHIRTSEMRQREIIEPDSLGG